MRGYDRHVFPRATTGLGGALGYIVDDLGTDEETQPDEAPRSSFWDFLGKATETVPTAVVKGVDAYGKYTTTGGGTNGVLNAALSLFGQNQQAQVAATKAAAVKAAAAAAAATPWYKKPVVIVGIVAVAGVGVWAWRRK